MEKKINVAELLKDCPKGMELDCTMYDNLYFDSLDTDYYGTINCYTLIAGTKTSISFTKYGTFNNHMGAKCVIFPKGKTTWEGFVPPCNFKAGDVLVSENGNIVLLSHIDSENVVNYHCIIPTYGSFRIEENTSIGVGRYYECVLANEQQRQRMYDKIKCSGYKYNQHLNKLEQLTEQKFKDGDIVTWEDRGSLIAFIYKERKNTAVVKYHFALYTGSLGTFTDGEIALVESELVFATEEEKEKLFKAIKANGYKWNSETKTLEKLVQPKFKVGDRVRYKNNHNVIFTITSLDEDYYGCGIANAFCFEDQDDYELVPNKFDITTLKPFDKVLARCSSLEKWHIQLFEKYDKTCKYPFICMGYNVNKYKECIPYEQNEHLLDTTDNCDEYYKTW